MDPLSTNKLTQEKCQRILKLCCTGGKTKDISPIPCIRCKEEWLVEKEGYTTSLKASVGADPLLPPTTGWLFKNWRTGEFEEDASTTCTPFSSSPPCCLTVTLSGAAKEAHGDCEGEYKSTGLISMGRPVNISTMLCPRYEHRIILICIKGHAGGIL